MKIFEYNFNKGFDNRLMQLLTPDQLVELGRNADGPATKSTGTPTGPEATITQDGKVTVNNGSGNTSLQKSNLPGVGVRSFGSVQPLYNYRANSYRQTAPGVYYTNDGTNTRLYADPDNAGVYYTKRDNNGMLSELYNGNLSGGLDNAINTNTNTYTGANVNRALMSAMRNRNSTFIDSNGKSHNMGEMRRGQARRLRRSENKAWRSQQLMNRVGNAGQIQNGTNNISYSTDVPVGQTNTANNGNFVGKSWNDYLSESTNANTANVKNNWSKYAGYNANTPMKTFNQVKSNIMQRYGLGELSWNNAFGNANDFKSLATAIGAANNTGVKSGNYAYGKNFDLAIYNYLTSGQMRQTGKNQYVWDKLPNTSTSNTTLGLKHGGLISRSKFKRI